MRIRRGRYRELLPRVVCDHGTPDGWELRAMAALLWAGGDAVLARASAARLHGWELPPTTTRGIHLLTRVRSGPCPAGVVRHRSAGFDLARDTVHVGVLRCTAPARTVVDLAGGLAPASLRDVVAQGLRRGQLDAARLHRAMRHAGPVAGSRALRQVLAEVSPLHAACRSWLEGAFVDLTHGTGLEPTAMNHPVCDARGHRRRLDAVYLPEHLPVELDGAAAHSTPLDLADDADREEQVLLAGPWRPFLRFSHDDVVHRGPAVLAAIEARLSTLGSSRTRVG